jgi:4'-phosphopantetheinyl transferase
MPALTALLAGSASLPPLPDTMISGNLRGSTAARNRFARRFESVKRVSMNADRCKMSSSKTWLPETAPGLLYVWLVKLTEIAEKPLLQRYADLLSLQERGRWQRFVFAKDRHRDLVTRALVRTTLSRFSSVEPPDWRFVDNGYGRPMVDPRHAGVPSLSFNISHAGDWTVMAVGHALDLGVDIEDCRRGAPLDLADRYFARSEAADLSRLPAEEQPSRFFELWTLKESYIKARGLGLSIPLDSFAFDLREKGSVALACDHSCDENPSAWRFELVRPDSGHVVSLCFRPRAHQPVGILWLKGIPLQEEAPVQPVVLRRTPSVPSTLR